VGGGGAGSRAQPALERRTQAAERAAYAAVALLSVPVLARLGPLGISWVLLAGALSAAGGAAYALRRPNPWPGVFAYHEVFHALVVAGIGALYVAIALYALPAAG
jgi:hemolysin III